MDKKFKIEHSAFIVTKFMKLGSSNLGKILVVMSNILKKEVDNDNKYQQVLYPWFKQNLPKMIELFDNMLYYKSEKDRSVRFRTLDDAIAKNATIAADNRKILKYTNFGPLLAAAIQRATFISEKDAPNVVSSDKEKLDSFNVLKKQVKELLDYLKTLEEPFLEIIKLSRKESNVDMDKVVENRKNKKKNRMSKNNA